MEWACAGTLLWVILALAGGAALIGLVVLLLKLGVILHYATKPEPQDTARDYSLDESHESRQEGER